MTIDADIHEFYARSNEQDRLSHGLGQLESERTRRILTRFCAPAPSTVLDVGGGAGAYAFWLAERGYAVHLVDAIAALTEHARVRDATARHPLASISVGDARGLSFPDESADIVLLLGPLYHLPDVSDREACLHEARRVLRPGGQLVAAAVSRWATLLYGLAHDLFAEPAFGTLAWNGVRTGVNENPERVRGGFTTAYFHRPEELRDEIGASGFVVDRMLGVEGPACLLPDFDDSWRDERKRENMLEIAEALDAEPSVVGASAHLLALATKR